MIVIMVIILMPPVIWMARSRGGIPVMILWIIWPGITAISCSLITARDIRVSRGSNIRVPHTIEDILLGEPLAIVLSSTHFFSHQRDVSLMLGRMVNIFAFLITLNFVQHHVLPILHIIMYDRSSRISSFWVISGCGTFSTASLFLRMCALTILWAWYASCISLSCQEQSCNLCTAWQIFLSDTLECWSSVPSWMGWVQENWLPLMDWEESLVDSRANSSWAFLKHSLASWILISSSSSHWTCPSSWSDPISLPSLDGDWDRVLLSAGDDRSWLCAPNRASVDVLLQASALLVPSLCLCVLFPALPVNTNSFVFCLESFQMM